MKHALPVLFLSLMLAACATAPMPGDLDQLPVVRFGEPVPDDDYVLLFEAGTEIPLSMVIDGSLVDRGIDLQRAVTLQRSIYAYKDWISYDGQHWDKMDKMLDIRLQLKLPGYHYPHPGLMHLEVNTR